MNSNNIRWTGEPWIFMSGFCDSTREIHSILRLACNDQRGHSGDHHCTWNGQLVGWPDSEQCQAVYEPTGHRCIAASGHLGDHITPMGNGTSWSWRDVPVNTFATSTHITVYPQPAIGVHEPVQRPRPRTREQRRKRRAR